MSVRKALCHPERVYHAKDKCRRCYMNDYYAHGKNGAIKPAWLAKQQERGRALKLEMIAAYGGKCACCGEAEPDFLSLEHLNGGRVDRPNGTTQLLRRLKRSGWPKAGYTCLCMNCNFAKGHRADGRCPHERNR